MGVKRGSSFYQPYYHECATQVCTEIQIHQVQIVKSGSATAAVPPYLAEIINPPISKEEILLKYKELKELEKEKVAFEKANQKNIIQRIFLALDAKKVYLYNYRQGLATFSIIISLFFVLTENFHKVRYTILTDPYGTEFVYDRFTGKIQKKINY